MRTKNSLRLQLRVRHRGFTLIELLIAIAIIGTLASIVVIAVNPTRQLASARDAKRSSDAVNLEKALYQYMIDKGSMPVTMPGDSSAAKAVCREGTTDPSCLDFDLLTPDYLAAIPLDATETNPFFSGYKAYQQVGRPRVVSTYLGTDGGAGGGAGGVTLITNGLVGYWKFDETSGTIAADSSGNGNTGTHTNGLTISSTAAPVSFTNPRSLSFDGTDDYIIVPPNATLAPATISVSLWVKFTGTTTADSMLTYTNSTSWTQGYGFDLYSDGFLKFWINHYGSNQANAGIAPTLNQWYHLVGTYDLSNIKFYVNGLLVATKAYSTPIGYTGISAFEIGRGQNDIYNTSGNIDDIRVYNRALTPSEITQIASGNG